MERSPCIVNGCKNISKDKNDDRCKNCKHRFKYLLNGERSTGTGKDNMAIAHKVLYPGQRGDNGDV